jgi:hypothetical protein
MCYSFPQGWLKETELLYGAYHPGNLSLGNDMVYSIPKAYFFTNMAIYIVWSIILAVT